LGSNEDAEFIIRVGPEDNLLLKEARNNLAIFEEFVKLYKKEFIDILVDDLFKITALVKKTKKKFSSNELFFLGLNLLLMFQETGIDNKDIVCEVLNDFQGQSDIEKVISMWPLVSEEIPGEIGEKNLSFFSLDCLHELDKRNGTNHYDMGRTLFKNFTQVLIKADDKVSREETEVEAIINEAIFQKRTESEAALNMLPGFIRVEEKEAEGGEKEPSAQTKEEEYDRAMAEIDNLIGLENIKEQIKTLINLIHVNQIRRERSLPTTDISLHAVFYGPPGTGKTTIARLLGKVFKSLGVLKKGHVVETDRSGLVAGFVGQTAQMTLEKINEALDGILFVDEAYALKPPHDGNDFGQEATETILKNMEDKRNELVVIVAGYPDEMKQFIQSNPGLKSRFSRYFYFKDYEPKELLLIFKKFCKDAALRTTEKTNLKLLLHFTELYKNRDKSFGNGRMVRNVFEKCIENQANRLVKVSPITDEILSTIEEADVPGIETFIL
jgi:SpoVK/Ycf46/Vps4 family AAA+-type ATPase